MARLELQPIDFTEAREFVRLFHRHNSEPQGHKFSIAVNDGTKVRGVLTAGRPINRHMDDGWTLEVTRCCTDGVNNGCSMLYGAAWRASKALGYKRLITYTLKSETGSSLKAAGFSVVAEVKGRSWSSKSRHRVDTMPLQDKFRWELLDYG